MGDYVYLVVEYLFLVEEFFICMYFKVLIKWCLVVFLYDVLEYVIGDMIFLVKVVVGSGYGVLDECFMVVIYICFGLFVVFFKIVKF